MSSGGATIVTKANVSEAWVGALDALVQPGATAITPLIVNVVGFSGGEVPETATTRELVNEALSANPKKFCSTETTAGLIFPATLWARYRKEGASRFFERYLKIAPRLRRAHPRNKKGVYFERLVSWNGKRQLEHILSNWKRGNHRRSALQAVIFDPAVDHTAEPFMNFPCLDYIAFAYDEGKGLSLTALYATQYVFDRGYGNYLGLCRLGAFMAGEMGLTFRQLTCVVSCAEIGTPSKGDARALLEKIHAAEKNGLDAGAALPPGTAA
jgi:hypothetical protein